MSLKHEEIIQACRPILEEVQSHRIGGECPFLVGYQIWHELQAIQDPICATIEGAAGSAEGKGGGSQDGPVKRIAQALGHCGDVETQYLDTRGITIDGVKPSGRYCGIFRLR